MDRAFTSRRASRAGLLLSAAALGASALALPACVVVVGNESKTYVSGDEVQLSRARIGVSLSDVGPASAAQLGIDRERSSLVTQVASGKPADLAGLEKWDIITAVNGDPEAGPSDVANAVRKLGKGDEITFTVLRGGESREMTVTIGG
ncbi:MAG: PDZ domain-containing protein [Phycisphaerales bacterium]|jgi:S1-C subfamily serine protease|nr:PDZ domain-containing protein [Phycisphaerales bacterium]